MERLISCFFVLFSLFQHQKGKKNSVTVTLCMIVSSIADIKKN